MLLNGVPVPWNTRRRIPNGNLQTSPMIQPQPRVLTLAQAGATLRLVQPWLPDKRGYAPFLNLTVQLTLPPAPPSNGALGGTLPTLTGGVGAAGSTDVPPSARTVDAPDS